MKAEQAIKAIEECTCPDRYSFESRTGGYVIYFGRCLHRHGYNIATLTRCRRDFPRAIVEVLNRPGAEKQRREALEAVRGYLKNMGKDRSKTQERLLQLVTEALK